MARELTAPLEAAPDRSRPLWLLGPSRDLLIVLLPLTLVALSFAAETLGPPRAHAEANGLAMWVAVNVLGNGTHVILTFLLFLLRPETMRSTPSLRGQVYAGVVLMSLVSFGFLLLHWWEPQASISARAAVFGIFGTHHTLSQNKGWWGLHLMRERAAGRTPDATEGRLLRLLVPIHLSLILVRYFLVPADAGDPSAFIDVGQSMLLPFASLLLLLLIWLAYWIAAMRVAGRTGTGPKRLYLSAVAFATLLALLTPTWAVVFFAAMHGLEYYFLSERMLEQRDGDPRRVDKRWIWPLMVLSMAPLAAIGAISLLKKEPGFAEHLAAFTSGGLWQFLVTASTACVLAHYWADALIYRFRIPEVRAVMLKRISL